MQPSNSKKYKSLEKSLLDVFQEDRFLVLPYFGVLRAESVIPVEGSHSLDIDINHVKLTPDTSCAVPSHQITRIAKHMEITVFDAKVILNQWIGVIKSDLRSQSLWSSPAFGTMTSNDHGISFSFHTDHSKPLDNAFYGLGKVDIPPALEIKTTTMEDERSNSIRLSKNKEVKSSMISARALAASFVLGMVTLSLFSFEGNRVGSPVYDMLHPQNTIYVAPNEVSVDEDLATNREKILRDNPNEDANETESNVVSSKDANEENFNKEELQEEVKETHQEVKHEVDPEDHKPTSPEGKTSFIVLGSFSSKKNAQRAIRQFESLALPNSLTYKSNGTLYRVGLHHSLDDWKKINKDLDLPYWVLR